MRRIFPQWQHRYPSGGTVEEIQAYFDARQGGIHHEYCPAENILGCPSHRYFKGRQDMGLVSYIQGNRI